MVYIMEVELQKVVYRGKIFKRIGNIAFIYKFKDVVIDREKYSPISDVVYD